MSRYASKTSVSPERSRMEIERTVTRYGADAFSFGWEGRNAYVQFRCKGKIVRLLIQMPDRNDPEFARTEARRQMRSPEARFKAWEQACNQKWRALALLVKAKLEAVESDIGTFEEEFMAHIVMPDGRTAAQTIMPAIEQAYATGKLPNVSFLALPAPKDDDTIDAEVSE